MPSTHADISRRRVLLSAAALALLTAVAADRTAQAEALSDELSRIGAASASTGTGTTTSAAEPSPGTDAAAPSVDEVVNALKESADRAARLAAKLSGYRAGLLGSIAASCTAAYTVALGGAQ